MLVVEKEDTLNYFKRKYIEECINGNGMSEELIDLFQNVLVNNFDDNPILMDSFIQEIVDSQKPPEDTTGDSEKVNELIDMINDLKEENESMKSQIVLAQGAVMDLARMVLSQGLM